MLDLVTVIGTHLPRSAARLFPDLLWRMPADERTAYLTFDDGPNPKITGRIIDVLDRYGAKGTFFLLGSKAEQHPGLVKVLVDGGHTLGNHTYAHPDAWRTSRAAIVREMGRTTKVVEDITGQRVRYMRPPYGHFTPTMCSWCAERRQRLTMWDLAPGDYLEQVSQEAVEDHVTKCIQPGSIIVLHDNPRCAQKTPDALEGILKRLSSDGWMFKGLSDPGSPR